MSEYQNLLFEKKDGIGLVTINRPKALNALNAATLTELDNLLDVIAKDEAVKVVIVAGGGDKAFVAGADIAEMQPMSAVEGRNWGKFGQAVFNKLENLPKPVIAAVGGFALGGGCELAMACDIRLAADNAIFGQPEVGLGVIPGFGGTQRLPRLVGEGRAKELTYRANNINAEEAYRIGLVNHVYPAGQLMEEARKMAGEIASKARLAVGFAKFAIGKGMQVDIDTAMSIESDMFGMCTSTFDQKEGMGAFLEKRKPAFQGR